jgi:hypothetical protein
VVGLLNSITRSEDSLADVVKVIYEGGEPGNFRGSNNCNLFADSLKFLVCDLNFWVLYFSFEIDKELDELLILDQLGRSRLNPG